MGGSLLTHYRKVIKVRRQYPEIARGEYTALKFTGTMAGGFLCTLGDSTAGVFHNTTEKEQSLDLTGTAASGLSQVAAVLAVDPLEGGAELKDGILTLGPQTSAVLKCSVIPRDFSAYPAVRFSSIFQGHFSLWYPSLPLPDSDAVFRSDIHAVSGLNTVETDEVVELRQGRVDPHV